MAVIESKPQRGMPIWLSLLVILLALGGGGSLLVWLLKDPTPTKAVALDPSNAAVRQGPPVNFNRPRRNPNQPPQQIVVYAADDVIPDSPAADNKNFTVKSGKGEIRVQDTTLRFRYQRNEDLASQRQIEINMLPRLLTNNNDELAKKNNLSADQIAKIKEQTRGLGMRISDADRLKLTNLWNDYKNAADKTKFKKPLLDALKDISEKSLPATKQAVEERVKAVESILTPDQLNALVKTK